MILTHKFPISGGHRLMCYQDYHGCENLIGSDVMNATEAQEMAADLLGIVQDLLIEHPNKNLTEIIEQVISDITQPEKKNETTDTRRTY